MVVGIACDCRLGKLLCSKKKKKPAQCVVSVGSRLASITAAVTHNVKRIELHSDNSEAFPTFLHAVCYAPSVPLIAGMVSH